MALERLRASLADRYRLERQLGQGGMATVYRAEDLKHKRKVAVKVLKPDLAAVLGAERFVQEITTTAQLQHPHILPLFDSGEAGGFLYYVMPYIKGETVRAKLNRETQFGIEEAVRITSEVADALDYAHRHGVIHRDIKPENILLHDGRAMVMDFGIALAVSAAAGGRMTETGLSLGTPHYMSPEQATADKTITARSDIYSLASVLYEMLTGQPPHLGGSAQQIIMKIVTEEPAPVTRARKSVPPNVAAAVARALEKVPADRFATAKEFSDALRDPHFRWTSAAVPSAPAGTVTPTGRNAILGSIIIAAVGLTIGVWGWWRGGAEDPDPPLMLTLETDVAGGLQDTPVISPDGASFALANRLGIAVRGSGQAEFQHLPGTTGASDPVFSPHGDTLLFILDGRLSPGATASRLLRNTQRGETPFVLPDGSGVLYVDIGAAYRLMLFDFAADSAVALVENSGAAEYVSIGHIVFGRQDQGLLAVPFDLARGLVTGPELPVVNDALVDATSRDFSVSRNGTLVYGGTPEVRSSLIGIDLEGRVDTLPSLTTGGYLPLSPAGRILASLRLSPDGRTLAVSSGISRSSDRYVALYDLATGAYNQLTFEGGAHSPVWSPDGRWMAYSAELPGSIAEDLYVQPLDGSASPRRVMQMPDDQHAWAWPNDSTLAFTGVEGGLALVNPFTEDPTPRTWVSTPNSRYLQLDVSPDGRFGTYAVEADGTSEIYARRFPEGGGQTKISANGGINPHWSADGQTIYFKDPDFRVLLAARMQLDPRLAVVRVDTLTVLETESFSWDVDPRSGRIVATLDEFNITSARIMLNWFETLRRRSP
jgi:serine/threonine-protein kinase